MPNAPYSGRYGQVMNNQDINRIKFGKDNWVYAHHNKAVIGGGFIHKNHHLTISFGNASGYLDLHLTRNLTNNEKHHYPIISISHVDIIKIFHAVSFKVFDALFGEFTAFDLHWLVENDAKIWPLRNRDFKINDIFEENINDGLLSLKKGRKIVIDKSSDEFSKMVSTLNKQYNSEWKEYLYDPSILESLESGYGLILLKNEVKVYFRINLEGKYLNYHFDQMNLDLPKILKHIFGNDLYELVDNRIKEGDIKLQESDYNKERVERLVFTLKE